MTTKLFLRHLYGTRRRAALFGVFVGYILVNINSSFVWYDLCNQQSTHRENS